MATHKGNILLLTLVGIAVVLAAAGGYFLWIKQNPATPPVTESKTDPRLYWNTFTNNKLGIELQYPEGVTVSSSPPLLGIEKVTVYNGYDNLGIELDNKNDIPELTLDEVSSIPIIVDGKPVIVNGKGLSKIKVLKKSPGSAITYFVVIIPDSKNAGVSAVARYYFLNGIVSKGSNELFDQILSTFKFIDQSPGTTRYTCPQNGWVDCMPILSPEKKLACSQEAMTWYKKNCPNFQGAAQ